MRGKLDGARKVHIKRDTPAYARKTAVGWNRSGIEWEHPRVCGENGARRTSVATPTGTPPRMRGKQLVIVPLKNLKGNTPAYAGKTLRHQRVYRAKPSFSITSSDKPNTTTHVLGASNRVLIPESRVLTLCDELVDFEQANLQGKTINRYCSGISVARNLDTVAQGS